MFVCSCCFVDQVRRVVRALRFARLGRGTPKNARSLGAMPLRKFCGKFLVLLNARLAPPTAAEEYWPRALGEG
jgi:hypothetical protein